MFTQPYMGIGIGKFTKREKENERNTSSEVGLLLISQKISYTLYKHY